MKKNNIVLIGMPGCGKSFVCNKLAEKLPDYIPVDTDCVIEKTQGMSITEIFSKYSEDYFRKLEYDTIKLVCTGESKIISVGGGAFENPDTRCTLLNFGTVFYLKSDIDVLYYRILQNSNRPLLNCKNPRETLAKLLKARENNYQKAHYIIDTGALLIEEVVDFILGNINETNTSCKCK